MRYVVVGLIVCLFGGLFPTSFTSSEANAAVTAFGLQDAKQLVKRYILAPRKFLFDPAKDNHGTLPQLAYGIQFLVESIQSNAHHLARATLENNDQVFSSQEDQLIDNLDRLKKLLNELEGRIRVKLADPKLETKLSGLLKTFRLEFCIATMRVMEKAHAPNVEGPELDRYHAAAKRTAQTFLAIQNILPQSQWK